jgi:hypothetical protein
LEEEEKTLQESVADSCRACGRNSLLLKVKSELGGLRARRNVVRTAEGGKKIVNSGFVGQVDDGESQTPFVPIPVEEIVVANRKIKKIPRLHAGGILVVVFGSCRRYL